MRNDMTMLLIIALLLALASCEADPDTDDDNEVVAHQVDNDSTDDTLPAGAMDHGLGGTVLYNDGSPVAGAFIQVECIGEPCAAIPDLGVLSNESGHFRWPLPPGRFRVVARLDDRVSESLEIRVLEAHTPAMVLTLDNLPNDRQRTAPP